MIRILLIGLLALLTAVPGFAHPLGNNTVNRQATLHITAEGIEFDYLVDQAEIPTLVQTQDADVDGDGTTTPAEWDAYAERWALDTARQLTIDVNGKTVPLALKSSAWKLVPGAADLFTLRLEAHYRVSDTVSPMTLAYSDINRLHDLGWKEIWIDAAPGVTLVRTSAATSDRSKRLTDFSSAAGGDLPNELAARAEVLLAPLARQPVEQRTVGKPGAVATEVADPKAQTRTGPQARTSERASASSIETTPPRAVPDLPATRVARPELATPNAAPAKDSWQARAWVFFRLGVHHIATGWDHLVFLLGLLLLRQSLMQVVRVVTAFTVAHSLTLALAANGLVTPPGMLIEPAIALTIAYVGFINLVWRSTRDSAWLAFGFGLVHGFGFAGALAQTMAESPGGGAQHGWLIDLASFNVGIEAFQVFLVLCSLPLLAWATRYSWAGNAHRAASFAVCACGLGWFFTRTLGGSF